MLVELLDAADIFILAAAGGGRGRVDGILPGEDHIVGGEGFAVVPNHPLFEAPDGPGAIPRAAAVLDAGDLRRQNRDELTLRSDGVQRFVDDARNRDVPRAASEVRVEHRRRVPIQQAQLPATASPGWGDGWL